MWTRLRWNRYVHNVSPQLLGQFLFRYKAMTQMIIDFVVNKKHIPLLVRNGPACNTAHYNLNNWVAHYNLNNLGVTLQAHNYLVTRGGGGANTNFVI